MAIRHNLSFDDVITLCARLEKEGNNKLAVLISEFADNPIGRSILARSPKDFPPGKIPLLKTIDIQSMGFVIICQKLLSHAPSNLADVKECEELLTNFSKRTRLKK